MNAKTLRFALAALGAAFLLSACAGGLAEGRALTDSAVALKHAAEDRVIQEAEVERQRLRAARCGLINLGAFARNASRMGPAWVGELLRDCPEFRRLIESLSLDMLEDRGIRPQASSLFGPSILEGLRLFAALEKEGGADIVPLIAGEVVVAPDEHIVKPPVEAVGRDRHVDPFGKSPG